MSAPQDFSSMLSNQPLQTAPNPLSHNSSQPNMQDMTSKPAASPMAVAAAPRPPPEFSAPTYCKLGQETVQDIVARTQEIFQTLRTIQPPNGNIQGINSANERKKRTQDQINVVMLLMKRLRYIYNKCCDLTKNLDMSYTHVETLIPLNEGWDGKSDERKNTEAYRQETVERDALREQVAVANKEIKDALDLMRRIVWEINAMLAMRRN